MPTVSEIISIAKVSEYLAAVDIYKSGINFGGNDVGLPRKLYCIRKNVEKVFDLDPTDDTLTKTANYLFSLCNRYAFKAQTILNIASGGTIAPVTPSGSLPLPFDYEVTAISTPLANGESSVVLSTFIGFNIAFNRNNIPQSTVNQGGSYYSWNRATGSFSVSPSAVTGELFQIIPIG